MRALALVTLLGLGACALTPQQTTDVKLACKVDGAIHPIANTVLSLVPYGSLGDTVAVEQFPGPFPFMNDAEYPGAPTNHTVG